ncbi:MAG: hypothetical protein EB127_19380 [Alphaproteobacteria bacterium]|nr:hypothetical protein [Alphaproteobacteria bacterium]
MATENSGGFGRTLYKFFSNKLPYTNYSVVDQFEQLNPKFKLFHDQGTSRQEALQRQSISSSLTFENDAVANVLRESEFFQYMYANVQTDKPKRIMDYRIMAAFSEVADALDEICDECINKNEKGEIVKLAFSTDDLKDHEKDDLEKEFQKYINYFNLDQNGWEYFRRLLVEAELYFEHVIHKKYPLEGVLGIVSIPTELIDPIFSNVQNMMVKGYLLRKPVMDPQNPLKIKDFKMIPMDKNQVTYINSGIWNENKTIRLPFIENARRAYRQLSLIEDSIVIYRLVRAPERLVFNVDVGNMSPPKAEAYLRKLMSNYWSKRTFDIDQNGTVQKFNPQSMLDSFWFAKRAGSEGTTVTTLDGGQNLGELEDLMYFVKKLYKSLKVPTSRLNPDDKYETGENILREELKFAKFVVRLQQRFASGLKNGFITHLRLKELWEKYKLKENHIELTFNPPTNFYELREQQKLELKLNNFTNLSQSEAISKTYAQKRYLGWTDTDIKANREFLRKDKEFQWELAQIEAGGPSWQKTGGTPVQAGGEGGGGGAPPAFGPGAATVGGAAAPAETEAPAGAEAGAEAGGTEAGTTPTA